MIAVLCGIIGFMVGMLALYLMTVRAHKVPSLTKYVAFSIGVLIVYSISEMVISTMTGVSHDTLTTCVFSAFGGEILSCAIIKVFKLKEENNE